VRIELGDSDFPPTPGSGGSFGAASAGSALYDACENLRGQLAHRRASIPTQACSPTAAPRRRQDSRPGEARWRPGLRAEGEIKPGDMAKKYTQQAYGAHFAEVAVDMDSGEVRLRRMLGVFAAGRILNEDGHQRRCSAG
jgi:xanthine dehydrogenase YagR molybdenum-binding subunit